MIDPLGIVLLALGGCGVLLAAALWWRQRERVGLRNWLGAFSVAYVLLLAGGIASNFLRPWIMLLLWWVR